MPERHVDVQSFSELVLKLGYVKDVEPDAVQFEDGERRIYKTKLGESGPSAKQATAEVRSVFDSCREDSGETIAFHKSGWVYIVPIGESEDADSFDPSSYKIA